MKHGSWQAKVRWLPLPFHLAEHTKAELEAYIRSSTALATAGSRPPEQQAPPPSPEESNQMLAAHLGPLIHAGGYAGTQHRSRGT